jgi:hypothetical protein
MVPTGPETSVWNYHCMHRNIPEERRSQNYVITVQISILFLNILKYEPPAATKYYLITIKFKKVFSMFTLAKILVTYTKKW